ncbi:MAG: U32 family peptidase [Alphaproteobacteria bacterium]|nr:U32 family peptidase [Alphaproteobacteria bacterium]
MAVKKGHPLKLTLGPVLFNWSPEKWRDFYFRIADEAAVDVVYIGEVVCSKRAPFFAPVLPDVLKRLKKAKKEIVLSSLAMVMNKREVQATRKLATDKKTMIEANDVSVLLHLNGRSHVIGSYINVYNEETLFWLAKKGARRFCLLPEMSFSSIEALATEARKNRADIEVQVFGRMPLALSSRCYHARADKLSKDNCQFVCGKDVDGMTLHTLENKPFLAINGVQTLSDSYVDLLKGLQPMKDAGVRYFRLSPHNCDMVKIISLYRETLNRKITATEASRKLCKLLPKEKFSNGYFYGLAGHKFKKGYL